MRQTILKIYTYKDLLEDKIPEEVFEVIEGIGVESMPFSAFHNRWVFEISKYLENVFSKDYWVVPHETSILVSKNPLTYINADIVFEIVVSYEPNVEYKMNAYQRIGVLKQFWVYPKERRVIVIDRDGNKVEYPFNKKIEFIEGKKILLSRFKI